MSVNAREDQMQHAQIFGKPILFTNWPILRDTVPAGWYCYDLRGSDQCPGKAVTLEDKVCVNYAGTVLSPVPLKKPATTARRINGGFFLDGEQMDLEGFCAEHGLEYPQETRKYLLRPASPDEEGLFFSTDDVQDRELACVGHLRMDFGYRGKEFWPTWWPHNNDELNVPAFKAELDEVMAELRECGPLKDFSAMADYCSAYPGGRLEGGAGGSFGFIAESEGYRYCLRCIPRQGDYNGYLYIYDKHQQALNMAQKQQFGLTEAGKQALRDAADPSKPHTYQWFVIENMDMDDEELTGGLTLENAIQRFKEADCGIKVLGVTKDGISTIDLVVNRYGELQHLTYYQTFDSSKEDPVILAAVETLHKALDAPEEAPGMKMEGM